jgi:hypothetical protein
VAGLVLGEHDDLSGALGEALEHGQSLARSEWTARVDRFHRCELLRDDLDRAHTP